MRNSNFIVIEANAVREALEEQARADYLCGVDDYKSFVLDVAVIRQRDHKSRLEMLRQRGIPYPKINYRGCA